MSTTTRTQQLELLASMEAAYYRLVLGESVQVMQHRAGEQGTNVTYVPADATRLKQEITNLKRELGLLPRRRAMTVYF